MAEKLKKPLKRCNDVIRFPSLCQCVCSCGVMIPFQHEWIYKKKFRILTPYNFCCCCHFSEPSFSVYLRVSMAGWISKCYHVRCVTIAVIYLRKCHFCAIWWKYFIICCATMSFNTISYSCENVWRCCCCCRPGWGWQIYIQFNLSPKPTMSYKRLTTIMRKNKYSKCTNNIRSLLEIVGIFKLYTYKKS